MKKPKMGMIFLALCLLLCGCGKQAAQTGQRLVIAADAEGNYGSFDLPDEEQTVSYSGLANVQITLEGKQTALSDALKDEAVTPELLDAWARLDAKDGYCTQTVTSKCGYAQYRYQYADFTLYAIHDVFEAPDGTQYPMDTLTFAAPDQELDDYFPRKMVNGEGVNLAREDWGVTFEVSKATPEGITVRCTQAGGQHYGELTLADGYTLLDAEGKTVYSAAAAYVQKDAAAMTNGGTSAFDVDWSRALGRLPEGDYTFCFALEDQHGALSPMQKNYTDYQNYSVAFTVAEGA